MPVCSFCGHELVCTNPHTSADQQVGAATQSCPLKKGAIYVYVKNELGNGVSGIPVKCAGANQNSDGTGFAFFDPLDEGTYATSITLTSGLTNDYYIASKASVDGKVTKGNITLLEFAIDRYSTLRAVVKRSDDSRKLKDVDIKLETAAPDAAPPTPQKKTLENAPVEFPKLKRASYKVTATLTGADKDNFAFDGSAEVNQGVDPSKDNLVEFIVTPSGWVEIKLVDDKNNPVKVEATFLLEQDGKDKADKKSGADGVLKIEKLDPGKVKVHQIALDGCYEFVELTSAEAPPK